MVFFLASLLSPVFVRGRRRTPTAPPSLQPQVSEDDTTTDSDYIPESETESDDSCESGDYMTDTASDSDEDASPPTEGDA